MITGLLNHQQYQCISMLVLMVQKCKNQLRLAVYPIKFTMVFFKPIQTVVGNLGFLNHQQCYLFCFLQKCGKIPIRNGQDLPPSIIRTRSWGISEDGQGNKKFKLIEYMLLTSHLEVSYIHVYREMIWKKHELSFLHHLELQWNWLRDLFAVSIFMFCKILKLDVLSKQRDLFLFCFACKV